MSLDGDVLRDAARDVQRAGVLARGRPLRGVDVHQDRPALVCRDVEGERVTLFACDRIHVRHQRVRPDAGCAVSAGLRGHVDERLAVEDHVAAGDGVARSVGEPVEAHRDAAGLARDHHLEGLELVLRGGDLRGRSGIRRRLRRGADLLRGRRDPDLGGGCGTGGEQSDEQGEHLHG